MIDIGVDWKCDFGEENIKLTDIESGRGRLMEFKVFGTKECPECKASMKQLDFYLKRWEVSDQVGLCFYDMETVEGLVEGAYNEVVKIPTTVLVNTVGHLARWEGIVPPAVDVKVYLSDAIMERREKVA